ncbi:hypothetical protein R5R35_000246 [Gryllus longicercus]|uniref:Cation-dependent mannose-6-phosphate receptor n=1 Tax=Gryllus longicercus TaxID=2509291 RepID=A0AAN9VSF3_9ORTH|nr:Uncharacterized protein GBIM_06106 [Gryllus bimaculatus]
MMNLLCRVFLFLACFILVLAEVSTKAKQIQTSNDVFPQRLSSLRDQKFSVKVNETNYSVVIAAQNNSGISVVTQEEKNINHTLGRNNETTWMQSDSWIMVKYGSGDMYNISKSNGTWSTNILILCNVDIHQPELKFVGENHQGNYFYMFELVTCAVCPHEGLHDEGLSRGSVFCIIFLTSVGVYLIIGICYRRMVVGAKGFEQIPHHKFWTRLGNLQADGCNLVCRREEEETWQRLTSNPPKDTQDDQDDALLRP